MANYPHTKVCPAKRLRTRCSERGQTLGALAQGSHKSGVTTTYDAPNDAPFGAGTGRAGRHLRTA